ncbi:MAG TPA: hypothetical protein VKV30_15410 [Candidatus Angelobacter sp.]|nr:hypothetical protein [Candidatus Angelobacter sp.]
MDAEERCAVLNKQHAIGADMEERAAIRKLCSQNGETANKKRLSGAVKSIANWQKGTYNKWFFSELRFPGKVNPSQFFN